MVFSVLSETALEKMEDQRRGKRSEFPKVLMLCHDTIQSFTGGGATLRGLFSAFPPEKLFSIHNDENAPETSRLGASYRLTNDDVQYFQPINLAHALSKSGRRRARFGPAKRESSIADEKNIGASTSSAKGIRSGLRSIISQAAYFRFPAAVFAALREFRPDLLYGWIGDPLWCRTVTRLAAQLRLPYVVHFMDNHVGLEPHPGYAGKLSARLFRHQVDRTVAGAAVVLAISDVMAAAFAARWQRPVQAFHGVMSTQDWPRPTARIANPVFEVAFTGSIERGQLLGLIDVASAVEQLCNRGVAVRLVLYITDYYRERVGERFTAFKHVVIRPHPVAERLRAALVQSEALILAYGFDQSTIDYYRYSFPTKLVPYMLSGIPILAYGPASIAPIDYVLTGNWAKVITVNSVERLAAGLLELVRHPAERIRLGALAHEAGRSEHDQSVVAPRFAQALRAALSCSGK